MTRKSAKKFGGSEKIFGGSEFFFGGSEIFLGPTSFSSKSGPGVFRANARGGKRLTRKKLACLPANL